MTGCDTAQYGAAVNDFGTATASVVQQTKSAYQLVNDTVQAQKIGELADRSGPINPDKDFGPFISDENLAVRTQLLDGLQAYSTTLSAITSKTKSDLDTETTKLGGSLTSLAKNDRLQHSLREVREVSPDALNGVSAGVEFIGNFIINHEIGKELPGKLKTAAPTINKIAEILADEIGDTPKGLGLRQVVWLAYDRQILDLVRSVTADAAGSQKKRDDLNALLALTLAQKRGDKALEDTRASLLKLVAAHNALLKVSEAPATFKATLAEVWTEAKEAQDFYSKLPTK
jgi:hypothetical protein